MAAILRPIVRFSSPFDRREIVASSHSVRRPLISDRQRSLLRTCKRDFHASLPYTTAPKSQSLLLRNFRHLRTCEPPCRRVARMQKYIQRRFLSEFREKPTSNQPEPSPWTGIDPRVKIATVLLSIAALYYLFHLERVPETGRWRFMAVSEEVEVRLQDSQYKELLEEYRGRILPPEHPLTRQIQSVVTTILEANGLGILASTFPDSLKQKGINVPAPDVEIWDPDAGQTQTDLTTDDLSSFESYDGKTRRKWNLLVVADDSTINAMVVNGNIVVFTGILPVAHDTDGLAAVLSHEIAHVVARHLSEKLSARVLIEGLFYALKLLGFDLGIGPLVVDYLYHLPNSRAMELEADKIGLQLSARACYDPRGAVAMQTRLAKLESLNSPRMNLTFLQTHPSGQIRVKLLRDALPQAFALRAASGACAQLEDDFDAFRAMAKDVRNEQERELVE